MASGDEIARVLGAIPTAGLIVGTFVSLNPDGTVQIDFGAGPVPCLSAGSSQPLPGTSVRCVQFDGGVVMLGPAAPQSTFGTVTATGALALTVTVGGVSLQLPFMVSYTPRAINDVVLIDWDSGGVVLGKLSAVPGASYVYVPTTPPIQAYTADFRADDSGSFESGSWNKNDVYCSSSNIGAWFYGSTIAGTIPDGAVINRVQLYVPEYYNQFPSSLATIGLHTLPTKAGTPSISSAGTISQGTGWKDLPVGFGDALKTGAALGVGTNHGGYHKFRGRATDADSGLLRIDWTV